ncbi:MAG: M28 family peptidase [Clostridia bacterium]|nr:M28 family peptidase [Clostridia bacterium]
MNLKKNAKDNLEYMIEGIKYVCNNFKARAPGSQSERDAQAFFKEELGKYSDEVIMEDFDLHPHAFMGFIPFAAIFGIIAVAGYWLAPVVGSWLAVVAFALILFSVLMFIFEFMFYGEFVDFLFPKRVSRNVYATRKPTGEVKRRIIFGGHADVAAEWTYSYIGELKALAPVMGGAIGGMFVIFCALLAYLIKVISTSFAVVELTGVWKVLGIVMLVFIPFLIAIIFFINWRIYVDGANDNLSACYIAAAVLKAMSDNDIRFENTEVGCFISGAEEAGIRGARAFARKHKKELQDVESVLIAMDTMREIEQLQIYNIGCTGTVHSSKAVGDLIHEAGINCGIDMPRAQLYPGAIDSDAWAQEGLTAAGFCGVNHDPKRYYHTRQDTADNISPECIELSLEICLEIAELYDKNGGIKHYEEARKNKK